ncbi:MBL fold metallo-hydrolase [Sediminicola luteus]|uniref:Metallo-beta-lactamase domain-containing protein n=1 Tax=Sediminicola luteus TaxID=319238 RepID=A0A2A4G7I4_9FLAO|nr:MBL fold metallo-hydrolase [Sediminicola luteus]PCE63914.1 hypothetical protein B7P33_11685 [Sediminicola luteus]
MVVDQSYDFGPVSGFRFGKTLFGPVKLSVLIYHIDGLLIDTGAPNMRGPILDRLSDLPVNQIFLTHHHEDHSGNVPALQQAFSCKTFTTTACAQVMRTPPKMSLPQHMVWGKYQAIHNMEVVENWLETENYRFEIIELPGHASDMAGLLEQNQGWFFSADLYIHHYITYFKRDEHMGQQIASLKKALSLDFDTLFCAHNPQLEGGKEKLRQKLAFLEDFKGKVDQYAQMGLAPKEILKKMALKEKTMMRFMSGGELSVINMIRAALKP